MILKIKKCLHNGLLDRLVVSYMCENSILRYQKKSSQDVDLQSIASVRYEELRERRNFVIENIISQESQKVK